MRASIRRASLGLLVTLPLVASTPAARAATLHVPADHPTIAAAFTAALDGDEIVIACGTYFEHDIQKSFTGSLTVRSETGDPSCVTIDAEHLGRGFDVHAGGGAVAFEGLTITHARAPGTPYEEAGGGIKSNRAELTVRRCRFVANGPPPGDLENGAGVLALYGSVTVEDCEFIENRGSGLQHGDSSDALLVTGSRFVDNAGAGIALNVATATVSGCEFVGNASAIAGQTWTGALLEQCSFHENTGVTGGAVDLRRAPVTIDRCEFVGNTAAVTGGAIYLRGVLPQDAHTISFSTFSGNFAPLGLDGSVAISTFTVRCCDANPLFWQPYEDATLVLDDEDCAIGVEGTSWGGVKALYR